MEGNNSRRSYRSVENSYTPAQRQTLCNEKISKYLPVIPPEEHIHVVIKSPQETSRDGCAVNDASGDALRNTSAQNLEAKGQIVQVGASLRGHFWMFLVKIPTGDASGIAFS
ncbi:hypothetical protein RhiirA4_468316 [Rhizophagus irregularis]|uniref:Uncharacterized protein n=1 Tax=Rhizophagus irregularis TaxID=588596 RepID=A0A2I1GXG9_9GLOM|nr:hypothetical protein RhiirA4_468316 [Rhizophagus irregularis]